MRRLFYIGFLLGAFSLPNLAVAQGADDAPLFYFDIETGLRFEDDSTTGTESSFDTRLGLGIFTATSNRRLSFEASTLAQTLGGEAFLTDPSVALSYSIFNRGAEISLGLDYTANDLDDVVLDDDFDADDLIEDGGRRERVEVSAGLVTGRDAPFGTETDLRYLENDYSDGATADDETLISATTTLRFTLNPQINLRTTGFLSRRDEDDVGNTVETIHQYGLGADLLIDPAWSANLDFGFREIETETDVLGTRVRTAVDGIEAGLVVTRDMRNGALTFSANRSVIETGFEDTLRVRRALVLANGAEISGSLGAVIFEGADPIAIYGASYVNEIRPGSRLNFSLDRTGGVNDDDENIIRTRLNAGFDQDLTPNSSWSLDTGLLLVEDASLTGMDTSRFDVTLGYTHALTVDWNVAARLQHQVTDDGMAENRVNTVSLSLERRFFWRP